MSAIKGLSGYPAVGPLRSTPASCPGRFSPAVCSELFWDEPNSPPLSWVSVSLVFIFPFWGDFPLSLFFTFLESSFSNRVMVFCFPLWCLIALSSGPWERQKVSRHTLVFFASQCLKGSFFEEKPRQRQLLLVVLIQFCKVLINCLWSWLYRKKSQKEKHQYSILMHIYGI